MRKDHPGWLAFLLGIFPAAIAGAAMLGVKDSGADGAALGICLYLAVNATLVTVVECFKHRD